MNVTRKDTNVYIEYIRSFKRMHWIQMMIFNRYECYYKMETNVNIGWIRIS